jgi:hypothetical protein
MRSCFIHLIEQGPAEPLWSKGQHALGRFARRVADESQSKPAKLRSQTTSRQDHTKWVNGGQDRWILWLRTIALPNQHALERLNFVISFVLDFLFTG